MGVIDGQAVSAAITNAAFLNKNQADTMPFDLTISAALNFPKTTISTSGVINALPGASVNIKLTGSGVTLNGILAGADGEVVILQNGTGSAITINSLSSLAAAADQIQLSLPSISLADKTSIFFAYDSTLQKWIQVAGSGSSSGSGGAKNYFTINNANPTFGTNATSPWSACTLTLTSGIPSGAPTLSATQMAITTTGTNPLLVSQSNYNLQLTKSAANAQGQGFISGALTIDREDLAKVLTGSFSYEVVSGTVDFSGQPTQSLEIWIYNTVSGAWTQPAGYRGMNTGSGAGVVTFTFQTDSVAANNTYRIAVITAQTSTSNYVVNFNDFVVGPTVVVNGTPVTDWQSYTPTFTAFGTATNIQFQWRRVGSDVEIRGKFTLGVTTGSEARITLPPGLTSADTARIPSIQIVGYGVKNNFTTTQYAILQEPSVAYHTLGTQSGATSGLTKSIGTDIGSTGQLFSYFAKIPIQGWSSNVQISSDTDTRVVAAKAQVSSGSPVANSQINYSTIILDTHGAITTGAGWRYTAPVSGIYRVSITHSTGVSNNLFGLFKNGTMESNMAFVLGTAGSNAICGSSTTVSLVAGDYIDIRPGSSNGSYTSGGGTGSSVANSNYITIERLSGPSVVAATESVNASYYLSANFASSPTVPVNFDTKEFDSHNAVTTSPTAWRFTAPVSGTYDVGAYFYPTSGASNLNLYKNGSLYKVVAYAVNGTSKSSGVVPMKLNAGDYVDLRTDGSTTVTGGAQTSTNTAWFQVKRTGN